MEPALIADRNYWSTYKNWLIHWVGELPSPAELGMDRVFEFTRRALDAAAREQVMHVIETPTPWAFKRTENRTWFDYVRELFERKGDVVLFPGGGPTRQIGGRLSLPARLAYYKGGRVIEEDVEDPGLLLKALHSPDPRTEGDIGRYSTTPIWLHGDSRPDENNGPGRPSRDPLHVTLSLFTDIWFPRVIGLNVGDYLGRITDVTPAHPARGRDGLMDNSALAERHTPRLNRFIETLRQSVLELGGTWAFDPEETDSRYLPMLHEGGINLDHPAANA